MSICGRDEFGFGEKISKGPFKSFFYLFFWATPNCPKEVLLALCSKINSGRLGDHTKCGGSNLVSHVRGKCPTHCAIALTHARILLNIFSFALGSLLVVLRVCSWLCSQ